MLTCRPKFSSPLPLVPSPALCVHSVDGDTSTFWQSRHNLFHSSLFFDLNREETVRRVQIYTRLSVRARALVGGSGNGLGLGWAKMGESVLEIGWDWKAVESTM